MTRVPRRFIRPRVRRRRRDGRGAQLDRQGAREIPRLGEPLWTDEPGELLSTLLELQEIFDRDEGRRGLDLD